MIIEDTGYIALGRSGAEERRINPLEASPLPEGSSLSFLPQRLPIGFSLRKRKVETFRKKSRRLLVVAALPPPGYTRSLLPAFRREGNPSPLPFFAYTAVGLKDDQIWFAAIPTEKNIRWDPSQYDSPDLEKRIKEKLRLHAKNKILDQLAFCSTAYHCYTAQNIFHGRWEGGIPISPFCNACCIGCISYQERGSPPSPQERLKFVPTAEEIVDLAVPHLESREAIVSFGQGCEGEPTMQADLLARAITEIRRRTKMGTININTNAGNTKSIRKLLDAGLDAMRVSVNSCRKELYDAYFRPIGYDLDDVRRSILLARERGCFVSLNLLYLPGVNDAKVEMEHLFDFIGETGVNQVQLRNLNIDPDIYFRIIPPPSGKTLGLVQFLKVLRKRFPDLLIGNFTPPLRS